jgi:hypothetical protein
MAWRMRAGTHTARCGGTIQKPAAVSTCMTPERAKTSCAPRWACGAM